MSSLSDVSLAHFTELDDGVEMLSIVSLLSFSL